MRIIARAFAVVAVFSVQAAAAQNIVSISVAGKVEAGQDNLGLFGNAGQDLAGASYGMKFVYDITNAMDAGNTRQLNGGTSLGTPSPLMSATVSINGSAFSVINPYDASYSRWLNPGYSELNFSTFGPSGVNSNGFIWARADQTIPLPLDAAVQRTFDSSDTVVSWFVRTNADWTVFTSLSLRPETIETSASSAAVPEPASWAVMISGFALVGAAVRTSRQPKIATTA